MDNQVDQGFFFPSEFAAAAVSIQPWPISALNSFSPCQFSDANYPAVNDYDNNSSWLSTLPSLPAPPSSIYGDLYPCRGSGSLQFPHDHGIMGSSPASPDPLGLSALYAGSSAVSSSPFGSLHAELISEMSAQEIMDAKAQAASKSHSVAERRRRERINAHLARLRGLLPNTTKVRNLLNVSNLHVILSDLCGICCVIISLSNYSFINNVR